MKKTVYIVAISMLLGVSLNAQMYSSQWVIGPSISLMDFRDSDTIHLYTNTSAMQIYETSANICDQYGNLLYFTNGIYIANSTGDTIANGTGINPCPYTTDYAGSGLNIKQAALFLPKPGDSSLYYLIHFSNDTLNEERPGTIYYSIINKNYNNGLGEVLQKNIPILQNVVLREGGMTACKHANGRDYWIIMGGINSNLFYKLLITPDTILGPFTQNIGPVYPGPYDLIYSKFSEDGSKYVTGAVEGYITVMNFDRCTGEFSNPDSIFNQACDSPMSCSGSVAVEFSPNGRFVYVSDRVNLNQYDLWSSNIQDSAIEIYRADSTDFAEIDFIQVAPNGKLYGSTWNGGVDSMHVVNYPDLKGDSCGFVWEGQPTLSLNSYNLPNMINYNLGPLAGPCDTIKTVGIVPLVENNMLHLLPNPADQYVYVEMGMQGNYEFDLLNTIGQVIDRKETRQVDIFDTENLVSGVYFLRVIDKTTFNKIAVQKVVIQH